MKRTFYITNQCVSVLKRHLFAYLVIVAFLVANPDFARSEDNKDNSGFYFLLEGRFAFADGDETPFAEDTAGNVFNIDSQKGGGGRIGGGYRFGDWDAGLFYSGLRMSDTNGPQYQLTPSSVYVYPLYPLLATYLPYFSYSQTKGEAELTYHVVDFEAGFNLQLGKTNARLFAGVRYANFDQDVNTTLFTPSYTNPSVFLYSMVEKRDVDFWGIGPRVGASARRPIVGAFGVSGSVSGSALFGELDTLTIQRGDLFPPSRVSRGRDRTVWNLEGELGFTYQTELFKAMTMMLTLGYSAESWYGVNDTRSGQPGVFTGTIYGSTEANQFFHGPFLRGEFRFE